MVRHVVALGDLVETDAADVRSVLAQAAARWAVIEISAEVGSRAEQASPIEPVRTLDALHLASALLIRLLQRAKAPSMSCRTDYDCSRRPR